jgi:hypothetical protein
MKTGPKPRPMADLFWEKVSRLGPAECWPWLAAQNGKGYGKLKQGYAHRISWEIHSGAVPTGMLVCHTCDNRVCVNPAHLFLGTYADNNRDCREKGRHVSVGLPGERNGRAKLSDADVLDVARLVREGVSRPEIAKTYGITRERVYQLARSLNAVG